MTSEMPGGQRGSKGGGHLYGQREQQQQQDDDDLHAFTQIQGTIHVGKGAEMQSQPAKWLFDSPPRHAKHERAPCEREVIS